MSTFLEAVVSVSTAEATSFLQLDELPTDNEFGVRITGPNKAGIALDREALASFARSTLRYLAQKDGRDLDDEERALVDGPSIADPGEPDADPSFLKVEQRVRVDALWEARRLLSAADEAPEVSRYELLPAARFILTGSEDESETV